MPSYTFSFTAGPNLPTQSAVRGQLPIFSLPDSSGMPDLPSQPSTTTFAPPGFAVADLTSAMTTASPTVLLAAPVSAGLHQYTVTGVVGGTTTTIATLTTASPTTIDPSDWTTLQTSSTLVGSTTTIAASSSSTGLDLGGISSPESLPLNPPQNQSSPRPSGGALAGIIIGVFILTILATLSVYLCLRRHTSPRRGSDKIPLWTFMTGTASKDHSDPTAGRIPTQPQTLPSNVAELREFQTVPAGENGVTRKSSRSTGEPAPAIDDDTNEPRTTPRMFINSLHDHQSLMPGISTQNHGDTARYEPQPMLEIIPPAPRSTVNTNTNIEAVRSMPSSTQVYQPYTSTPSSQPLLDHSNSTFETTDNPIQTPSICTLRHSTTRSSNQSLLSRPSAEIIYLGKACTHDIAKAKRNSLAFTPQLITITQHQTHNDYTPKTDLKYNDHANAKASQRQHGCDDMVYQYQDNHIDSNIAENADSYPTRPLK